MNVPKWLKGEVWASPYGRQYVRVQTLMYPGGNARMEVYLTRKQARELRDSLTHILAVASPHDRNT